MAAMYGKRFNHLYIGAAVTVSSLSKPPQVLPSFTKSRNVGQRRDVDAGEDDSSLTCQPSGQNF